MGARVRRPPEDVKGRVRAAVVLVRRRKRRREIAELLQALIDKHPHERGFVAWDDSGTQ